MSNQGKGLQTAGQSAWWQQIYTKEDLIFNVQSFKQESKLNNLVRSVLLLLNAANVVFIVCIYNLHRLTMFFTNWTLLVTVLYFAIAIPTSKTRSLSLLAFHHIIFEISFMMNIIVVIVFWAVLFEQSIKDCDGDEKKILNVYLAHIIPGASVLINFVLSDVIVRAGHVKMVIVIATLYGYVNYLEVQKLGRPLYWFLTWKDATTIYIYAGLIVIFSGVYIGISALTLALKPRVQRVSNKQGPPEARKVKDQ